MNRTKPQATWYQKRSTALLLGVVAFGAAYGLASLAVSSGSLQQYFLLLVAIVYAINRFGHATLPRRVRS